MTAFEENEVSVTAAGGTEIAKRMLEKRLDPELLKHFQIVSSRVRDLDESKIRIYWAHDLPGDPECAFLSDHNLRSRFHKLVFVSDWQYQAFRVVHKLPWSRTSTVIVSGVDTIDARLDQKSREEIHLYYASTPNRGLEILLAVFERLAQKWPQARLHVHSSFKIYGWEDHDKSFEPLYDRARAHPQVTYHGLTSHDDLAEAIKGYHILAYPCTWQETSCRVLIEAMSGLCMPVHPNLGALPETSGGLTLMYDGDSDPNTHAQEFHSALDAAVSHVAAWQKGDAHGLDSRLALVKAYSDTKHSSDLVTKQWDVLLRNLLAAYPTEESRRSPKAMFYYDTSEAQ